MCPVGPYYPEGFNPIKLYADTSNVRAWPGGVGNTKVGKEGVGELCGWVWAHLYVCGRGWCLLSDDRGPRRRLTGRPAH